MTSQVRVRRASSRASLERILDRVEAGTDPRPDWIHLQGESRLDKLPAAEQERLVARLHRSVRRGFRHAETSLRGGDRLAFWRSLAAGGFHDFSDAGWTKNFDAPVVENYDYLEGYLRSGLAGLDPYAVYSSVLGTHDYTIEDFLGTKLCTNVRTIVEPMAGTAEFAYHGHFFRPNFRYVMIDLDTAARDRVMAQPWHAETEKHYIVSDVLDEAMWQQVKSLSSGESLAYIGKQSHHFFGARQLLRLMNLATHYTDYFMLEVPAPTLVADLPEVDEYTRPEMSDAGLHVALVDEPGGTPNPITHQMGFTLDAWDDSGRRTLFSYSKWVNWQMPMLVVLADLLGLRISYFHSEDHEFLPPVEGIESSDLDENVTFMIFTRRR